MSSTNHPTVGGYSTVEIDADLLAEVDEWTGSPEAADEFIEEAVAEKLAQGVDPRPDLSRDEYHRWFIQEAVREKLRTESKGESGPHSGGERRE